MEHVVSLFFFDHTIENHCGFTEAIYDFNRLVAKASPRGSTMMYDAVFSATDALRKFKVNYPDCLLRIVALTDGEDSGSNHSVEQTTRLLI
jgi:Mg-chelatase subunit ChlD